MHESNSALYAKIRAAYGVDASDISSVNLADMQMGSTPASSW
jgi:hypothetical protein